MRMRELSPVLESDMQTPSPHPPKKNVVPKYVQCSEMYATKKCLLRFCSRPDQNEF